MLTEEAVRQRMWGRWPELARLLERSDLGPEWTGPTSVSDNPFDSLERLFRLFALVDCHRELVQNEFARLDGARRRLGAEALPDEIEPIERRRMRLRSELRELADGLMHVSAQFADYAAKVQALARETGG
jgi:hypothetical protein